MKFYKKKQLNYFYPVDSLTLKIKMRFLIWFIILKMNDYLKNKFKLKEN